MKKIILVLVLVVSTIQAKTLTEEEYNKCTCQNPNHTYVLDYKKEEITKGAAKTAKLMYLYDVTYGICCSNCKLHIKKLQKMFENKKELKQRNKTILKAYEKGYSQHTIAKVLGVSQPAVNGVIRRSRK